MKLHLIALLTTLAVTLPLAAGPGHAHGKKLTGPHGGRVLTDVEPHVEFVVTSARTVELYALTDELKPGTFSGQIITIFAGDRSQPTKLELKADGDKLVSTTPLPAGNQFPVSVGIQPDATGKTTYARFNLNLATCPDCQRAEYVCTCEH